LFPWRDKSHAAHLPERTVGDLLPARKFPAELVMLSMTALHHALRDEYDFWCRAKTNWDLQI